MMRKVCHNLSGAGRSVLFNRIRDSRRQISMARPTDNGGDQGTGGQTNWYTRYLILGPAGAAGAVLTGKEDEDTELVEPEDLEFEIAQAGESKFRKTRLFKHFCSFASIKYKTEMYMTADDFFTAIVSKNSKEEESQTIRILEESEIEELLKSTPTHVTEGKGFLKQLGARAIISYSDYVFLVSLLNTNKENIFKMFQLIDTNQNLELDEKEFEILEYGLTGGCTDSSPDKTTMKLHFFKEDSSGGITFEDLSKFIEGLKNECLEAEFSNYSDGNDYNCITELEFTELLLSRTSLGRQAKNEYLIRVSNESGYDECKSDKMSSTGNNDVSFDQYSQFVNLFHNIHDLEIALRMFQIAKKPVTQEEFQRAVSVCTGARLDDKMINLTFKIFDEDGDGHLSHEEFIKVLKDRRRQGTVDVHATNNTWKIFMRCVHQRAKSSN